MNNQLKTVLLTVLTLSVFVIAIVELTGVSKTAIINRWAGDDGHVTNETVDISKMPKTMMTFEKMKHNFGTVTEGEKVRHAFKFKNTGEQVLIIADAIASCGCTIPKFPKRPIPPGGEGEIEVEFNTSGRPGHQQKNVIIKANTQPDAMSIGFEADVQPKK